MYVLLLICELLALLTSIAFEIHRSGSSDGINRGRAVVAFAMRAYFILVVTKYVDIVEKDIGIEEIASEGATHV